MRFVLAAWLTLLAAGVAHADPLVVWDSRRFRHHDSVERFLQKLEVSRAAEAKVVPLLDDTWRVYYRRTCDPSRPCRNTQPPPLGGDGR